MFKIYLGEFLNYLQAEKNASINTIQSYRKDLDDFYEYMQSRRTGSSYATDLEFLNNNSLRDYIVSLSEKGLSRATISRRISAIRSLVRFLCREGILAYNPLTSVTSPKKIKKLPRFLYPAEIEALLEAPDVSQPLGKRDKMIFEVLYATGIRVSELVGINLDDIDIKQSCIKIRGKGDKERLVLLGEKAQESIASYLSLSRSGLLKQNTREKALILNHNGHRLTARSIRNILNKYVEKIALKYKISPHTIRHTFATHLLNGGADLRSVQELLGHARLSTTQIYTHLTKENLKKIHNDAHPRR